VKVTITLAIDIDPDGWAETYGSNDTSATAIRDEIKRYVRNHVEYALDEYGVTDVQLKP